MHRYDEQEKNSTKTLIVAQTEDALDQPCTKHPSNRSVEAAKEADSFMATVFVEADVPPGTQSPVSQDDTNVLETKPNQKSNDHEDFDVVMIESWQMIVSRESFENLQSRAISLQKENEARRKCYDTNIAIMVQRERELMAELAYLKGKSLEKLREDNQCLRMELAHIERQLDDLESIDNDVQSSGNQPVKGPAWLWNSGPLRGRTPKPRIEDRIACQLQNKKKLMKEVRRLEKEKCDMQREFAVEGKQLSLELATVRKEASLASEATGNLFQMLQLATTKRQAKAAEGSFPDGDMIERQMKHLQVDAGDLLLDLVDLYNKSSTGKPITDDYRAVFDEVILSCLTYASEQADAFVTKKRDQLRNIVERAELLQNPLVNLFWTSTMQKVIKSRIDESDSELHFDTAYLENHPNSLALRWAESDIIYRSEETDGKNVGTLMRDFLHLKLVCEFSDPKCFLWPPLGSRVEFSSFHHTHMVLGRGKKVTDGAQVRILVPGLYFFDPSTSSSIHPVVKSLVLAL